MRRRLWGGASIPPRSVVGKCSSLIPRGSRVLRAGRRRGGRTRAGWFSLTLGCVLSSTRTFRQKPGRAWWAFSPNRTPPLPTNLPRWGFSSLPLPLRGPILQLLPFVQSWGNKPSLLPLFSLTPASFPVSCRCYPLCATSRCQSEGCPGEHFRGQGAEGLARPGSVSRKAAVFSPFPPPALGAGSLQNLGASEAVGWAAGSWL